MTRADPRRPAPNPRRTNEAVTKPKPGTHRPATRAEDHANPAPDPPDPRTPSPEPRPTHTRHTRTRPEKRDQRATPPVKRDPTHGHPAVTTRHES
ncbi:hypothetical protein HPP92_026860 [Vanilla planifolia]|uniref:Uncharacterized protein n=1 Tax=Vanilla planifolia TaxID=51239 RepID=A0A835U700_VANPL|nr:hypothetical protein HPP92_026860 [Vanilla planifolia]KAG0484877.1 hypothetical protein HPP92_008956 [Vanilla planifolia]